MPRLARQDPSELHCFAMSLERVGIQGASHACPYASKARPLNI